MRQLSPREIRLTSPRMLTPRMAAKVANANLQLPPVPSARPVKTTSSPLASAFTNSPTRVDPPELAPPLPAGPAVPFVKRSISPVSPSSLHDYFPTTAAPTISGETLERSRTKTVKTVSSEWKPRRPTRPPSPKIEHARTLSHSLSPELVDQLRSPPPSPAEEKDGKPRLRGRTNSISFKGLRNQMSSKNLNNLWRSQEKDRPEMPQRGVSETVGLFKGSVESTNSSFASLGGSTSTTAQISTDFGQQPRSPAIPTTSALLPSRSTQTGFASRILHGSFSFSRKPSDASHSKRNPSISSPVANSFHRIEQTSPGIAQATTPTSPTSSRSVKRKPVPGLSGGPVTESESI